MAMTVTAVADFASTIRYGGDVPVIESAEVLLKDARRRAGLTQAQLDYEIATIREYVRQKSGK